MLENKLFFKGQSFLLFIVFVFGLLSPISLFADQSLNDRLAAETRRVEGIINTYRSHLNSCRSSCESQCRNSCNMGGGNCDQCSQTAL